MAFRRILFFKKETDQELKIQSIRRYISRIEDLIDMDEKELILQEILEKEKQLKACEDAFMQEKQKLEEVRQKGESSESPLDESTKIEIVKQEKICLDSERELTNLKNELIELRSKIEKK